MAIKRTVLYGRQKMNSAILEKTNAEDKAALETKELMSKGSKKKELK